MLDRLRCLYEASLAGLSLGITLAATGLFRTHSESSLVLCLCPCLQISLRCPLVARLDQDHAPGLRGLGGDDALGGEWQVAHGLCQAHCQSRPMTKKRIHQTKIRQLREACGRYSRL